MMLQLQWLLDVQPDHVCIWGKFLLLVGWNRMKSLKNDWTKVSFRGAWPCLVDGFVLTLRIWLISIVDFLKKVKHMLKIRISFLTNLTKCWKNITSIEILTRNEYFNLFYNMKSEKWMNPQSRQIPLLKQSRSGIVGPARIRNRWQDERAKWSR